MVGSSYDDEEPRYCGSHIDKVWLLPFAMTCVALGYFGVQGIREFNIYKAGEEKARQLCEPLLGLSAECEQGLENNSAVLTDVLRSDELQTFRDQSGMWSSIQGDVDGVCDSVIQGADACASFTLEPSAGGCANLTNNLSDRCSNLVLGADAGGAKVQAAMSHQSNETVARFTSALNATAYALCPVVSRVGDSCSSLRERVDEALRAVMGQADRTLPDFVPRAVVDAALQDVHDAALKQVDTMCGGATGIAGNCLEMFSQEHWLPVLQSAVAPVQELLQTQLETAIQRLNSTAASCGDANWSVAEDACNNGQLSELYAVHSMTETCGSSFWSTSQQQCLQFKDTGTSIVRSLQSTMTTIDGLESLSGNVEVGCAAISELQAKCMAVANPGATLAKGATGLWQEHATEILTMELWLVLAGLLTTAVMLHVIKNHTAFIVTVSIVLNLLGLVGLAIFNLMIVNIPGAAVFLLLLVFKGLWFWCIRSRFAFAIRLIHCAVEAVEKLLGISVWLFGLLITCAQAGLLILAGGCYYHLTGNNAPPLVAELNEASPALLPALIVFALVWTTEVAANTLHISVCCSLGGCCGVHTPARTFPGAVGFALTGGLGSNCAGSFLVAALKGLQHILEKSEKTDNPCVKVVLKAVCCLLEVMLKMYNSFAFVFVGLKGASYCTAAKRTFDAMLKDGVTAIAADEALHDVVRIAKLVALYVSSLLALWLGYSMGIIGLWGASWQEVIVAPLLCIALASLTSYALTLTMGRLMEASVCTLFVVYGDESFGKCMKESQQALWEQLSGASTKEEAEEP